MNQLYPQGTKVYNEGGTEFGLVINAQHRRCACGKIGKLKVRWPDGANTFICPRGIAPFQDGYRIN